MGFDDEDEDDWRNKTSSEEDEIEEGYSDDNANSKIDPVTGKPRVTTTQPVYSEEKDKNYEY